MRRYVHALVALLLLAGLSGCAKERAGALPSAPPATAPASSPVAGPEAEVAAAARAYYAALESAGQTGDVSALRAVIHPSCDCADQVTTFEGYARAGQHLTTRYAVDGVTTHDVTATEGWATVTLTYAPSALIGADRRVAKTYPGKTKVGRDLLFRKEGTSWRLVRLVLLG